MKGEKRGRARPHRWKIPSRRQSAQWAIRRLTEEEREHPGRDRQLEEAIERLSEQNELTVPQQRFLVALGVALATGDPEDALPAVVQRACELLKGEWVSRKEVDLSLGPSERRVMQHMRPIREQLIAWLNPQDPDYSPKFAAAYMSVAKLPAELIRPWAFKMLAHRAVAGTRRDLELYLKVMGDLDDRPINLNSAKTETSFGVFEIPAPDPEPEPAVEPSDASRDTGS